MLLDDFFSEKLNELQFDDKIKAYIVSVCKQHVHTRYDYSNESLTILFYKACQSHDFSKFQNIADWSLWLGVFQEKAFNKHNDVYEMLARSSYDKCHNILKKQWPIFEQLADEFNEIVIQTRSKMIVPKQIIVIN